jgi:hypothetical protein
MNDFEKKVLRSLVKAGVVFEDDGKFKYVFDYFEKHMYCLKSGKFIKCTPIDMYKISKEDSVVQTKLKEGLKSSTKAYVSLKGDTAMFKIKDSEKTSGYVCQNTSSLTTEDLKNRINSYIPGLTHPQAKLKYYKQQLCYLFEILVRTFQPEDFQRPHFIKIETKKS